MQVVGFRLESTDRLETQVLRAGYRWKNCGAPTACGGPRPAAL